MDLEQMRKKILGDVKAYGDLKAQKTIVPGKDYIPASGKVVDGSELELLVDASMDMWFTTGRYAKIFENEFAKVMEQKYCLLVNSGSSANLIAFSALTSELLGARKINRGDEVITVAAGFPTTVNPILQAGCIPVFIDVNLSSFQIDIGLLDAARSPKTKALFVAHTLGNVFDLKEVKEFCVRHNLWLIEDCCDAVGARFDKKSVGTYGDIATVSFYPAHHITMGEGGAVLTNDSTLKRIAESFRDWGRDCWCPTGKDNSCKKRFAWELGALPKGYDHKYIYTHVGYNLKVTDMQAALGVAQLKKLSSFIEKRRKNFITLKNFMEPFSRYIQFIESHPLAEPSWFGFPMTIIDNSLFTRNDFRDYFEKNLIGTRMLFAGNLVRQPLYQKADFRIASSLTQSDKIMNDTFWVGIYPDLNEIHFKYMAMVTQNFLTERGL